nr:YadA-like family protein [Burkholderia pyrrocinia]
MSLSTLISKSETHYLSVNDNGTQQANYTNDGATGTNALAFGPSATAAGTNAIAIGNGANAAAEGATVVGANALGSGTNATALGTNATASAANSVALGAGSIASEANTVSVGSAGNERRITNVAAGVNPTDAVNVSQLNAVQSGVSNVARRAYSGVAGAAALTMIPEVDLGKTIAVGVGSATYQGYAAVALGFSARLTNNVKIKGGFSSSSSGYTVGGGISYQW